ncbi:MAG: lysophospholipid acyltransferase family protein [Halanaerobiaceae bacterium]
MGKIFYWLAYYVIKFYFIFIRRWQVEGKGNIPEEGPLIVMANHISALDPPIVGCIMNRQVYFMAKKELFSNPVMGWIFRKIGVFPVKRGKADLKALRTALRILKKGKVLGLFPEGTRHNPEKPGEVQGGAVLIALKSKSPILPVGIKNVSNNKRLTVSIGEPFTLEEFYDKKLSAEEKKEVGEKIMEKIKKEI